MKPEELQRLRDETSRGLSDVLARVSPDLERARLIARRAGYPPGQLPAVTTASAFWSAVIEDAVNGMLSVNALVGAALREFPGNRELRRFEAEFACQPDDAKAGAPEPAGPRHGPPHAWDSSPGAPPPADGSAYILTFAAIAFGILGLVALL